MFADRLRAKIETEKIKEEEDGKVLTEIQVKAEILTPRKMKRESNDQEKPLVAIEETIAQKSIKRRRKTYL